MTRVLFRIEVGGGVLAVFPLEAHSRDGWNCVCYAQIGQHSYCDPHYVRDQTQPAKPEEYAGLLSELESIGYDDLQIGKRFPRNAYAIRQGQYD